MLTHTSNLHPFSPFGKLLLSPPNGLNLSIAHKLIHFHQSDSNTESRGSIFLIEFPHKIRRPKVKNKYTPPYFVIDINGGIFDFEFYGKTVFRPKYIRKKSPYSRKFYKVVSGSIFSDLCWNTTTHH